MFSVISSQSWLISRAVTVVADHGQAVIKLSGGIVNMLQHLSEHLVSIRWKLLQERVERWNHGLILSDDLQYKH
jgi:hypothetical protein